MVFWVSQFRKPRSPNLNVDLQLCDTKIKTKTQHLCLQYTMTDNTAIRGKGGALDATSLLYFDLPSTATDFCFPTRGAWIRDQSGIV